VTLLSPLPGLAVRVLRKGASRTRRGGDRAQFVRAPTGAFVSALEERPYP
jgi:hypothetical protein